MRYKKKKRKKEKNDYREEEKKKTETKKLLKRELHGDSRAAGVPRFQIERESQRARRGLWSWNRESAFTSRRSCRSSKTFFRSSENHSRACEARVDDPSEALTAGSGTPPPFTSKSTPDLRLIQASNDTVTGYISYTYIKNYTIHRLDNFCASCRRNFSFYSYSPNG